MITHIVRMSIRPDVSPEQVGAAMQRMQEAAAEMASGDDTRSALFGRDFGDTFDFGSVSSIETLEQYEAMMNHPAHLEVDRIGLPLVDRFHSIDITDDADPEIGAKIADVHRRRFEAHPDLLELVNSVDDYRGSGVPGHD
ncbi:Stress responsive A/B Barrel Domain [Promicromonospora umidemergens]|uniref:Stress-response A/B barrel domain-containing protein n=1 Tax=Promicromonospora umidemergens TaxID=629679 RepID=A0ABP8XGW6_9MICO|nr:Dabb family protein [Promicromonospora umidemergens]MCP2284946.1 Stress responsive A/B Barrel Domain [Promicromonospora umidemergens]